MEENSSSTPSPAVCDDAAAEVGHDRLGSIAPLAHRLRGASFALAL